jgi:hypothetical protein
VVRYHAPPFVHARTGSVLPRLQLCKGKRGWAAYRGLGRLGACRAQELLPSEAKSTWASAHDGCHGWDCGRTATMAGGC